MRESDRIVWNCGTIVLIFARNNTRHASHRTAHPGEFSIFIGEGLA